MDLWIWFAFTALLVLLLVIDLGVLNRDAHVISAREALKQAAFWVALALCFNLGVYFLYDHHVAGLGLYHTPASRHQVGTTEPAPSAADPPATPPQPAASASSPPATAEASKSDGTAGADPDTHAGNHTRGLLPRNAWDAAIMWLTCYGVEMTLSLDNMLVIALIMGYFRIPAKYQHRVLFWGIVGAVVLRGSMILLGTALLREFSWFIYVFGAILLFSAIKMLMMDEDEASVEHNAAVRWTRKMFLVSEKFDGPKFLTRVAVAPDKTLHDVGERAPTPPAGSIVRRAITPLLLALIVIDIADAIFAIDSIPAAFGISLDSFIVFTSNMFAILGLRAMFFALTAGLDKFKYLKLAMIFVLLFIAIKMLASDFFHLSALTQLGITAGILFAGVMASLNKLKRPPEGLTRDIADLAEIGLVRAKRVTLIGIGLIIVLAGLLMTVPGMPGPGLLIIPIGLAILSAEFAWARYLNKKYMESAAAAGKFAGDTLIKKPRPWVIPSVVGLTISAALAMYFYFQPRPDQEFLHKHKQAIVWGFLIGSLIAQGLWAWETFARYNRAVREKGLEEANRARPSVWLGIGALIAIVAGSLAVYRYAPGSTLHATLVCVWAVLGCMLSIFWIVVSKNRPIVRMREDRHPSLPPSHADSIAPPPHPPAP